MDFWRKLSRGAASQGHLVQRARPKLAWNKALWNLCRLDGIASALPSRSAAVKLSALLMQTQLPYPSQLVFNLKFIKPCRKGRWNLQSILYRFCDNFNLKSNLKVGNALDTFFYLYYSLFYCLPLQCLYGGRVAITLQLPFHCLLDHWWFMDCSRRGAQSRMTTAFGWGCWGLCPVGSWKQLGMNSCGCPIAWLAPSVLCILHRTAQAARPWARITKDKGVLSRAWSKACCSVRTGVSKTDRHH